MADERKSKVSKLSHPGGMDESKDAPAESSNELAEFILERVLNDSSTAKSINLLGRFQGKPGEAILILVRQHLPVDITNCTQMLQSLRLTQTLNNDIYTKYTGRPDAPFGDLNVECIYPCTAKHIAKYSTQDFRIVEEDAATYRDVTSTYVAELPSASIQWVYNILDRKSEVDRLIFEDPDAHTGFMLHPDLKWDQAQVEQLYCVAIVHRRDVTSIRELRGEHVPLLENVREKGLTAIAEKYGVDRSRLRVYVHYPPTYFHLHVHFVSVDMDASHGMAVGKAHDLTGVIETLRLCPDYYQRATLTCVMGENHALYKKLAERRG